MFVWLDANTLYNYTDSKCLSAIGQVSGYTDGLFSSMIETGSPPGWQVIVMGFYCGGLTARTVHREVLRALGYINDESTLHDGRGGLTTSDALKIQEKYCKVKDDRNSFKKLKKY